MDNRGLLDLIISLLPDLRITDKIKLLESFNNEEELFVQSKKDIENILEHQIKTFWDIREIHEKAGRIDTICKMRSFNWVSYMDSDYPPLLRESYDPPPVIFYKGILPDPEKSLLGMVGTRNPSPQAAEQAYKIAGNIGRAGVSVISGLAIGIDTMSHRGNLIGNAPGFAVLGSGIDEIYPSLNRPLAKRILDSGGAIISEYPPGTKPAKWTFPARNRIIAAFSRSVLVVEAPEKSGSLITAAFALEQGKDLWVASSGVNVIPAGTDLREYLKYDKRGTTKLANDGAEIIHSACDVLEKWELAASGNYVNNAFLSIKINEDSLNEEQSAKKTLVSSMADFLKIEI
ncbi:MAG: DNA-processing protein DprA [Treponema sp.]|nr:DNA-processing protein DprA [Treponema sp.]